MMNHEQGKLAQNPTNNNPTNTIDEYIDRQPAVVQPTLHIIRDTIRSATPLATERIAWGMPTFWQGENLIHFAAFKHHIGLYPGGEVTTVSASRLSGYTTTTGSIHLPLGKPVDPTLIADIVTWRLAQLH